MSASLNQARFLGLDLKSLWRDLLTAWRGMLDWPVLTWLWTKLSVRLWLPTGERVLSRNMLIAPTQDGKGVRTARFDAVLLPESLLLRRNLSLPILQTQDLIAALALEAQNLNPFDPSDVVWTYEAIPKDGRIMRAHLLLTSRKLIAEHIEAVHPELKASLPEVWVPRADGVGFVMLAGFGEARRLRHSVAWRWVSALLAMLVLALIAAMALTPSIQLYLRTQQAHKAMSVLFQKVAPVLTQRESLTRTTDLINGLTEIIGKPIQPLQVLKRITDALPDDTYLWTLQLQGAKVNMTGQTVNTSVLMKQLDTTPGMSNVTAPTPASKLPGAPREQFAIEFTFNPVAAVPVK
jgi:general secretion pathway protein L